MRYKTTYSLVGITLRIIHPGLKFHDSSYGWNINDGCIEDDCMWITPYNYSRSIPYWKQYQNGDWRDCVREMTPVEINALPRWERCHYSHIFDLWAVGLNFQYVSTGAVHRAEHELNAIAWEVFNSDRDTFYAGFADDILELADDLVLELDTVERKSHMVSFLTAWAYTPTESYIPGEPTEYDVDIQLLGRVGNEVFRAVQS